MSPEFEKFLMKVIKIFMVLIIFAIFFPSCMMFLTML